MTNEERIAEWLHDRDKGYWHSNKKWEWTKENEQAKNVWRKQARSLIVFLDSLGFVQMDEDQSYGFIWTDEAGVFIKYRCPDGFVRVKSIVEGK
jgi:hypothetical protein